MKKRAIIVERAPRINIGNLISKLRRIRSELSLMMQQVDEALARIEQETA